MNPDWYKLTGWSLNLNCYNSYLYYCCCNYWYGTNFRCYIQVCKLYWVYCNWAYTFFLLNCYIVVMMNYCLTCSLSLKWLSCRYFHKYCCV